MRKFIALLLAIMLVLSLAISAYAATPTIKIPSINIPDISGSVEVKLPQSFWDNWFAEHPISFVTSIQAKRVY